MPPKHLKRSGIQLAEPFSERRLLNQGQFRTTWQPPYLLQTKLNGERCRAIVQNNMCLLVSSTDSLITSVPHINKAMTLLPPGEYDGELYVHGWTFSQIHSVVSTVTSIHPLAEQMQYHMFDLINEKAQLDRIIQLTNHLIIHKDARPHIKIVRTDLANTLTEIMSYYEEYIDQGYEGFIIRELRGYYSRRRSQLMMKFKPKETDEYPVFNLNEAISEDGKPLNTLGSFTCIDDSGTKFRVGAGKLNHQQRKEIWNDWQRFILDVKFGDMPKPWNLKIEYQTKSDKNKVPHFSRAVEVIR